MEEHPVTIVVDDDLRRSRPTVFFRLLLAIPHYIWFALWSVAVIAAVIVGWVATLVSGRLPVSLQRFFSAYIRYVSHLSAYLAIVADPYPSFTGGPGYPIDILLPDSERQPRWKTLLRLLLAIPALMLAGVLGGVGSAGAKTGGGSRKTSASSSASGLLLGVALLGWFSSLARGRMPSGLRDAGAYAIGYRAQTMAYVLLVTERYPDADPTALLSGVQRPGLHPIRLVGDSEDLRRSRVTVLFRLLLAIPHFVWLVLWSVVAILVSVMQWFITVVRGRPAANLHAFLARFVRYGFHVYAFVSLAANPFPGFAGLPGTYPLDLELPPPGRQSRWKTGFRLILVIPCWVISSALSGALAASAVLMWFVALLRGAVPPGLRNLAAYAIRYQGQLYGYLFLLTDTYPNACPLEGAAPPPLDAPVA